MVRDDEREEKIIPVRAVTDTMVALMYKIRELLTLDLALPFIYKT